MNASGRCSTLVGLSIRSFQRMLGLCGLAAILCLLHACAWLGSSNEDQQAAYGFLGDIQPAVRLSEPVAQSQQVSAAQVLEKYEQLMAITDDPQLREAISRRIANLRMQVSEQRQADAELADDGTIPDYYATTIQGYLALLASNAGQQNRDEILYQLAKAYELSGKQEMSVQTLQTLIADFPESAYVTEARFRLGEFYFSRKQYRSAEQYYTAVVDSGERTAYYRNGLYMQGWSYFKLNDFERAMEAFGKALDSILLYQDYELLAKNQAALVDDTLRIMSLMFSYQDAADSAAAFFTRLGGRDYEHLVFDRLGDLLLQQERYNDTAVSYQTYIERNPNRKWAPMFQVKSIEVYRKGRFLSRILPGKESFVAAYGTRSAFWSNSDADTRTYILQHLHQYLLELSQFYHAKAQDLKRQQQAARSASKQLLARDSFRQAADYYQQFVDAFPLDPEHDRLLFLLAESLYEAEDYQQAIVVYEEVAYLLQDHPRGADAGYSAVLAYQHLLDQAQQNLSAQAGSLSSIDTALAQRDIVDLRLLLIAAQLRFADRYAADSRAVALLAKASESQLELEDYPAAISSATKLSQWSPQPAEQYRLTAWLVLGHARFALQDYAIAEHDYGQARAIMGPKHKLYNDISERIAASVYRQAEGDLACGYWPQAVEHLLRVRDVAPQSPIRIQAEYDAATYLLREAQWSRAIEVLLTFRQRYPDHPYLQDIPAKLALAYEKEGQFGLAADELMIMALQEGDPEGARQAHYQAAEFYEKAGQQDDALDTYRSYAHKYPQPFAVVMEVRYKLSEFYVARNEPDKRRYWLQKLIDGDHDAGDKRSDRSRYLAALASTVFADDARVAFNRIKLTLPLKKSLKQKKKALQRALDAYQKTSAYGVEEFATLATYRIGEIYAQLSRDLMDSDRPRGLSELELEQYDILLEEQAFPFEEDAIRIHEANARRTWEGLYDNWVKESFTALRKLLPARYDKPESSLGTLQEIF